MKFILSNSTGLFFFKFIKKINLIQKLKFKINKPKRATTHHKLMLISLKEIEQEMVTGTILFTDIPAKYVGTFLSV